MIRIGFMGVPGSGKTSTTRALAAICRRIDQVENVELVSEYARRYISKHGGIEEPWEQVRILNKQLEWEDTAASKADLIITDSPVHLGLAYSLLFPRRTAKDLMLVNDMFSMLTKLDFPKPRYDVIFHLPPTLKHVADGVRAAEQFDDSWRRRMDERLCAVFTLLPPARFWTIKSTALDARADEALGVLKTYLESFENAPEIKF
jgi:nicotinamide riboside kinase